MSFPTSADPEPLLLSDPATMRALAHPIRIRLLAHLMVEGPTTATGCAEVVGQSVQLCSYHLRMLGGYGVVEEVSSPDGRERPWRAVPRQLTLAPAASASAEVRAASALLRDQFLAHDNAVLTDYLAHEQEHDPAWRTAALVDNGVVRVTPKELAAIGREFLASLSPYVRRDPTERPPDAARVLVSWRGIPWRDSADVEPQPTIGEPHDDSVQDGAPARENETPGTTDTHKNMVRRVIDEVFNAHDVDAMDRWYAEDYTDHNPLIPPGRDGYKRWFGPFLAAFPDLAATIEDLLAEGDKVVARTTWRGSHRAELMGMPATGKAVAYAAIDVFRIADGRIVEHWDQVDSLTMFQQLGLVQPLEVQSG